MPISYFAFITDSTDPNFNPSEAIGIPYDMQKGEYLHVVTDIGNYDITGLGAIAYNSEEEAQEQIVKIINEMGI